MTVIRTGTCMLCGKPGQLDLEDKALVARVLAWVRLPYMRRPLVQTELPELTPSQREQLMNGTHGECFDKAFPEED